MFRFFSIFIYSVKELVFDNKEEYDIKSSKFNTRKFIIFIVVSLSIFSTIIISFKALSLAKDNLD